MATTPRKTTPNRRNSPSVALEKRVAAVRTAVFSRLVEDESLVDTLLREMEASIAASTSGRDADSGKNEKNEKPRGQENASAMKAVLEQFLSSSASTSRSNLLGELKNCIGLEELAMRRCWEIMEEAWFDETLSNML